MKSAKNVSLGILRYFSELSPNLFEHPPFGIKECRKVVATYVSKKLLHAFQKIATKTNARIFRCIDL